MSLDRSRRNWRWARTCWSRSCPGTATTSRTRSSISERVVQEDRFTTIHIEELTCVARDTKLGPEDITADIPNVGDAALTKLDEAGIGYNRRRSARRRHPGGQGHAEGRDAADPGREAAARHLRREGQRREGHVAARSAGNGRHRDRRARVHARRRRERLARPHDRAHGNRQGQEGSAGPAAHPRGRSVSSACASRSSARPPRAERKKLRGKIEAAYLDDVPRERRTGSRSASRTRKRAASSKPPPSA